MSVRRDADVIIRGVRASAWREDRSGFSSS